MAPAITSAKSMRAVVFRGPGKITVEDHPIPHIQDPRDAIVKVSVAGVCGGDLHWVHPGHEFVGTVHELGSKVRGLAVGDEVVATFSTQCGDCFYCHKRQSSRCEKSFLFGNSEHPFGVDGGQAEYVRVLYTSTTLMPAPPLIQKRLLVLMADIFPTGYFCASRFLKQLPREEARSNVVVVVGCGPVGICALVAASKWCDRICAIDTMQGRLEEAKRLGATPLFLQNNPVAAVKAATNGRGADVVFEVVGSPDAMRLCIQLARRFGSISSIGLQKQKLEFDGPTLYEKNLTISWGACPVRSVFEDALTCLGGVQEKLEFLCDHQVSLEDEGGVSSV
ncbi:GroES-like protein [Aspergillus heterothallicus]